MTNSLAKNQVRSGQLIDGASGTPFQLSTTLESEANLTGENGATGFGSSLPVLGF
jgi:hypothetical protein